MTVIKCKMCGGSIEVNEGVSICECSYCGTNQTVMKQRDEIAVNMFNRANNLRMKSEFDKAYAQYEKLVLNAPNDPESYWGLILCKFGVEYVKAPATDKMIPTLHRTQVEPVATDTDYQSVLEYADARQRVIYEQEAAEIDRLQKDVLAVIQNESPYDVFICYKEKDEDGVRTKDSLIANDIYLQLTQEGLKVFYAAITLENKLGQEYEPYIYAALHSAKVMLVIGTCPEYFESVWMRNEWSRYLKIVQTERDKLMIPCYRDMDPYDLPDEFSHMQAQDMSKIGFITDILRVIRKTLNVEPVPQYEKKTVQSNGTNIDRILKRGDAALLVGDWSGAMELFDRALDEDPEDYRAYIGCLCSEVEVNDEASLARVGEPITNSKYYWRACRFGGKDIEDRLYSYVLQHWYDELMVHYDESVEMLQSELDYYDYYELADTFMWLSDSFQGLKEYKDSIQKSEECSQYREAARQKGKEEYLDGIRNSRPGEVVCFGLYEWIVLETNGNIKTLLCKDVVERREYHSTWIKNTWENCDLRKWLNTEFYNRFDDDDKALICKVKVDNPNNHEWKYRTKGGNPTEDYIFLPSLPEARQISKDILTTGVKWWLRSPGGVQDCASTVTEEGDVYFSGNVLDDGTIWVRPVLKIKI